MKYIIALMFLASCASKQKSEPWNVGDCVVYRPRALIGQIENVQQDKGSKEYFYGIAFFDEEKKDKVLEIIPCPKK